jgi:hypothetical protein
MSRGLYTFKERELSRAIRATVKAGVTGWRIEIADGKIIVVAAAPATAPDNTEETSADVRKLL